MANNPYVNKVEYAGDTLIDITDTTATENDVLPGKVFYKASGARSTGSLSTATQSTDGLMSSADKTKLDGVATGATANVGTVTGVKMNNGSAISPDNNGVVDLGTVITAHQDISGKVNKSGDTMTGNLTIQKTSGSDTGIYSKNSDTTLQTSLIIGSGKSNHGVYSNGYVDSNGTFHSGAKWIVNRGADGKVYLDGTAKESFLTAHQDITGKKNTQTAVSDPTADGTGVTFIDTISQNTQGVISPHKRTVRTFGKATADDAGSTGLVPAPAAGKQASFLRGDATWATPTNTKNTAGSTDSSSKLFLIGATSQAANPQTYSHDTAYVGTDGCLYSDSKKVVTGPSSATSNAVAIFDGTDSYKLKNSGFTIGKSVPSDANFTNTWRGIKDNLTSTSTTDSLSANQGKILADKIAPYEKLETSWAAAFEAQPTLSNGTHYQGGCRYRKFGVFVHIFISVQFTSAPTNKTLFTLPAGFRPIANVPIVCIGGENYNNKAECVIYTDGSVRCSSVDKYVIGSGLFIISA